MKLKLFITILLSLILVPLALSQEIKIGNSPTQCLQMALGSLKTLLIKNSKASNAQIKETIEWVFDLEETSRRSLGPTWNEISQEDQKEFIVVFSKLLISTYISKLRKVNEVTITFEREVVEGAKAVVAASVKDHGNVHPILFKLKSAGDIWKVYDMSVENVGLIANYRNEFAAITRKEGIKGLIKRLKEKSQ
jgi:phospholipid transport system substrate-binding protein